jgi:hypothetical protein
MAEDAPELAGLRQRYPEWQFWVRHEGGGYAARRFQAPTAEEPLQAATVEQLAADVAESERVRHEAQAYVDAVGRGMRAYFAAQALRAEAKQNAARQNAARNATRKTTRQNRANQNSETKDPARENQARR